MKIRNICLTVLITGACALSAHAQKQLRYLPQAVKAVPRVPYAVSPRLSPVMRAQFAMPTVRPQGVVVRPNVSAAVERQVAAKVTVQERIVRLEKNLKALEEYARTHGNSLPTTIGHDEFAGARRQAYTDIIVLKKFNIVPKDHPLFQRYNQLLEAEKALQQTTEDHIARLESNLSLLEEYARTHNDQLPPAYIETEASNLRRQILRDIVMLRSKKILPAGHPLFQRYNQLLEAEKALQPTPQERIARLEKNLAKLEEYILVHNNQMPSTNMDTEEANVRKQVIGDISVLKREQILPKTHPLFQRYNQLLESSAQQIKAEKQQQKLRYEEQRQKAILARVEQQEQEKLVRAEQRQQEKLAREEQERQVALARAEQREQEKLAREEQQQREEQLIQELRAQEQEAEKRAWHQVLLQDKAWKAQPEEIIDPAENAAKAAALSEEHLVFPGTVTDEYIDELLRFYNKLDPWGTGSIQ